ncbi:cbb3-type cytochrome c oxidase subunit I [Burkholderia cenocepacia]|uniref:cbb3-type cytochrome c oxidase subunit I n=1 Tax=Burkholderia cenocepacia TaxID=95486 RepID=UPI002AB7F2A0|nr:cbb3-type cytochrome c oxidase subunit I [Burkholderia cenocepacia]
MNFTLGVLLSLSFIITVLGLFVFIWAQSSGLLKMGQSAASVIFAEGEIGHAETFAGVSPENGAGADTHPDSAELRDRVLADQSSSSAALAFIASSVGWLLLGSLFGMLASLNFQVPDWLSGSPLVTFGRTRIVHLNIVTYGWASMAGIGVALWLLPRLLKTQLVGARFAIAGAVLWNLGVAMGCAAILFGWSDGLEWLEIPWQIGILLAIAGALAAVPLLLTLRHRKVDHLYVSVWYLSAALLWFPILYVIAKVPHVHFGVESAIVNWWFAHNVLGLWLTPLGLGTAYYLIAKIVGRPIHSYNLSLIGFWALAMFYSQAGVHHLIGGPVPEWIVTVSVVQSVMMVVPVIAVAINHMMTLKGHGAILRQSYSLRFVVLGSALYTLVSMQGSLEAVRSFNRVVHFTQYTIGHAHLGVYGFYSLIMFGAIYFLMPRVAGREWPNPKLIAWHFWLVVAGIGIYFVSLTIGGVLQGLAMLDPKQPFMASVNVTLPYLAARTVGGSLMTIGHCVFAYHFCKLLAMRTDSRVVPAVTADAS